MIEGNFDLKPEIKLDTKTPEIPIVRFNDFEIKRMKEKEGLSDEQITERAIVAAARIRQVNAEKERLEKERLANGKKIDLAA